MAMPSLFLDTAYVYALFNTRDQWHAKAVEWQKIIEADDRRLVTTQLILVEIGNGLAGKQFRTQAARIIRYLQENELVEVVSVSQTMFSRAFELFEERSDKDWGFTDCFSFVAMQDNDLTDALTADTHFRQAGFNALLLN